MAHLRKDPITKRWIITSTSRSAKPSDYVSVNNPIEDSASTCPFCVGREDKTTKTILSIMDKQGNWKARVVPNKYPVLSADSAEDCPCDDNLLYELQAAVGYHDIIIEHPLHNFDLYDATTEEIDTIFDIVVQRLNILANKPNMQYSLYFKNFGSDAGASLVHSHSQIITTPFIPIQMLESIHGSYEYYSKNIGCIYCAIIREEQKRGIRVVAENEMFIAFCPFASRSPYQISILPKEHYDSILSIEGHTRYLFSSIVHEVFSKIHKVLGKPAFNYVLSSLPNHIRASYSSSFHWSFEILPKLSKLAGFEMGSSVYINSVLPEHAAEMLRG